MALEEYKFITPSSETAQVKLQRLANDLQSMEEHYKTQEDDGASDEKLAVLEQNILDKRTEYEGLGGSYPEL